MARVTIDDIAREAGVSRGAVSFALNGRPGVSEATRERILRVAEQMNWRPHSAARALGGARADAVGLVVARPARTIGVEPFFGQLLAGLQDGLSAKSVSLSLMIVEDTAAEIEVYRRWVSEHRVDGFVVVDPQVKDPRFAVLEALGTPAVVLGGPGRHGHLSTVWADDREAMLSLVEYLAAIGHRRIAHLAGMPAFQHTQRRMRALRDCAKRLGLIGAVSIPTDFSDAQGAAATRTLLSAGRGQQPTAIIYDSDVMAVAGLAVAAEMSVPVPERLSIVSFEDSVLTRIVHPPITALTRDAFSLVEYLAAIGHRRIAHLAGMPAFQHTQRRMRALRDCAKRLGLIGAVSIPTDFSDAQGAAATRTLLSAGPGQQPTAIIYDSDVMAVAGLAVAAEMGVPVPERLSIVSFEDSVLTRIVHPPITALTRDAFSLGQQAAHSVLAAVESPALVRDLKTATPALTVRGSTAAPAA